MDSDGEEESDERAALHHGGEIGDSLELDNDDLEERNEEDNVDVELFDEELNLDDDLEDSIHIRNDDDDDEEEDDSDSEVEDDIEQLQEEEKKAKKIRGRSRTAGRKLTTFDTALPTTHSYLGEDLENLHGRTVYPDGEIVSLPLFHVPNVIAVPGQIIPLNLFHPQAISIMKLAIQADKTFGLMMCIEQGDDFPNIGVTCEIYSVKEVTEYGVTQMMLKAEGRQRFLILKIERQLDGVLMGRIRILSDAYISPQPRDSLICSQQCAPNAVRSAMISNKFHLVDHSWSTSVKRYMIGCNPKKTRLLCASVTPIQGWVYKLYNPYYLMDCLLSEIRSWNENLQFDTIPRDPVEFSHWITANLPFTKKMKIELLMTHSASLRMRKQVELMKKCASTLACRHCNTIVADKNDLFSLSKRGPMGAYVNPNGYVHETVTFYTVDNLALQGKKSTQFSWFPGYAWTITNCKTCGHHMGWRFTSTNRALKPSKFWGLTRASLKPVFKESKDAHQEKAKRDFRRSSDFQ